MLSFAAGRYSIQLSDVHRIMPKLRAEAAQPGNLSVMSSKKAKVDVLSTEDFRMCYFFRRMNQRHAVLLKEHIVLDPRTGQPMREPREDYDAYPQEQPRDATREGGSPEVIRVKEEPVDDDMANVNFGLPTTPVSRVQEQDMNDGIELDEGDTDVKPEIRVKYNGFSIFGKMLIVVVEPSSAEMKRVPHLFDSSDFGQEGMRQLSATPTPSAFRAARESSVASSRRSVTPAASRDSPRAKKRQRTSTEGSVRGSRGPGSIADALFRGTPTPSELGSQSPQARRSDSVMSFGTPAFRGNSGGSQRYSRASGVPSESVGIEEGSRERRTPNVAFREPSVALSDINADFDFSQFREKSATPASPAPRSASETPAVEGEPGPVDLEEEEWWRQSLREESEAFGLASQMLEREEDATEGDARGIGDDD